MSDEPRLEHGPFSPTLDWWEAIAAAAVYGRHAANSALTSEGS